MAEGRCDSGAPMRLFLRAPVPPTVPPGRDTSPGARLLFTSALAAEQQQLIEARAPGVGGQHERVPRDRFEVGAKYLVELV